MHENGYKWRFSASKITKGGKKSTFSAAHILVENVTEFESMSCKQTANPIWHFDPEMAEDKA